MKRLSVYGVATALGHFLALRHKGDHTDVVLYHFARDILCFISGWCECTEYQQNRALKMMDEKCIARLASIQKYERENPDG